MIGNFCYRLLLALREFGSVSGFDPTLNQFFR